MKTTLLSWGMILSAAFLPGMIHAKTFQVVCPLAPQENTRIYESFVQNCGAKEESSSYRVVVGSLEVDPKDEIKVKEILGRWIAQTQKSPRPLSFDLRSVTKDNKTLFIQTGGYFTALDTFRTQMNTALAQSKFPSGKKYALATDSKGFYVFSFAVASTENLSCYEKERAHRLLEDRLIQSQSVEPCCFSTVQLSPPTLVEG